MNEPEEEAVPVIEVCDELGAAKRRAHDAEKMTEAALAARNKLTAVLGRIEGAAKQLGWDGKACLGEWLARHVEGVVQVRAKAKEAGMALKAVRFVVNLDPEDAESFMFLLQQAQEEAY